MELELLEGFVGLEEVGHSAEAVVTDDTNMELADMFVLVNCLNQTIQTVVFEVHILEG